MAVMAVSPHHDFAFRLGGFGSPELIWRNHDDARLVSKAIRRSPAISAFPGWYPA